jgi:hypothetical protein
MLARGTTPRNPRVPGRRQPIGGPGGQFTTLVLSGDHLTVVTNPRFAAAIVDFLAQPG